MPEDFTVSSVIINPFLGAVKDFYKGVEEEKWRNRKPEIDEPFYNIEAEYILKNPSARQREEYITNLGRIVNE